MNIMCIIVYTTFDKVVFLTFQPLKHNTVHFGGVIVEFFRCIHTAKTIIYV